MQKKTYTYNRLKPCFRQQKDLAEESEKIGALESEKVS